MATRAEKQSELNRIQQEIAKLQRELVQLETDLANSRANPALAELIPSQERTLQRTQANITTLEQRAADVQAQIDAIPADPPAQSAAAEVATSGNGATQNPAPPPTSVAADTTTPPAAGTATSEVRTLTNTQNVPDASTPEIKAGGDPGAGPQEDAADPNSFKVNTASFSNLIQPEPNFLANFASYTYNIGWYLVPPQYVKDIDIMGKGVSQFPLLAQSGGAPVDRSTSDVGAGSDSSTSAPGADGIDTVTITAKKTKRASFFDVDYYIDGLEINTFMPNSKATQMSNSTIDYKFTVTEPYGITLLNNLYLTVDQMYKSIPGSTVKGNVNYAAAVYVLLIRFYGYDDNGKLMTPSTSTKANNTVPGDKDAILTKFFPFRIKTIKFRIANKLVEYEITGYPVGHDTGFSANRGVIPAPVQLAGATVKDVLSGSSGNAGTAPASVPTDGRSDTPAPSTSPPATTASLDAIPGNGF